MPGTLVEDFESLHQRLDQIRHLTLFFVGGTMKSGTSWLQMLLDRHPEISCRGEGRFTRKLCPILTVAVEGYNRFLSDRNGGVFRELTGYPLLGEAQTAYLLQAAILLQMAQQTSLPIRALGEKSPDNLSDMPLLEGLFPGARLVHILRDGRDAAVSGWFHNRRVSPDWVERHYQSLADYAADFAATWMVNLKQGEDFARRHPDLYWQVRYEELLARPRETLAGICRFLGVSDDPEVLSACVKAVAFEHLSGRRPGEENDQSFFRKGVVGDWRNHFDDAATQAFQKRAGEGLRRYGYI